MVNSFATADLGGAGTHALLLDLIFLIFMQFFREIGQIIDWCPLAVGAPSLGNPGSTTGFITFKCIWTSFLGLKTM